MSKLTTERVGLFFMVMSSMMDVLLCEGGFGGARPRVGYLCALPRWLVRVNLVGAFFVSHKCNEEAQII